MRTLSLLFISSLLPLTAASTALAAPTTLVAKSTQTAQVVQPSIGGIVLNLGPFTSTEYPFINLMLTAGGLASGNGFAFPSVLNSSGYPVSASLPQDISGVLSIPGSYTDSATHWVLEWSGKLGTSSKPGFQLVLSTGVKEIGASNCVSGSTAYNLTAYGTNCQIEFVFGGPHTSGMISFKFLAGAAFDGSLKGLALYRKSQQTVFKAGEIFNPDFIAAVQQLKPRVIRTLNWTYANNSNIANASQQTPSGAFSYSPRWDPSIWAGQSIGINTYSGKLSGISALVDGLTVQTQFVSANTGLATFELNGLGASPIANLAGTPLSAANSISANSLWTLTYDSSLKVWLGTKGGLNAGVPLAIQIALANKLGTDLWLNLPTHATDGFVSNLATTARDGLNGTQNTWFEYSNEIWNFNDYSFPQTTWAVARGATLGFPNANNERHYGFYGLRSRQMMGKITSIYGSKKTYRRVLASQAVGDLPTTKKWRFEGFDLNGSVFPSYCAAVGGVFGGGSCSGDPKYNAFPNRPVDYADVISYATYYSGAQLRNFSSNYANSMTSGGPSGYSVGLLGAATDFASGNSTQMTAALGWVDWDLRQGTRNGSAGTSTLQAFASGRDIGLGAIGLYPSWEATARTYDGTRPPGVANLFVVNYEGGMEGAAPATSKCTALGIDVSYCGAGGKIDLLLAAYKKSALFQAAVNDQMKGFLSQPHSLYSSWYEIAAQDQWSLYTTDIYSTPFLSLNSLKLLAQ